MARKDVFKGMKQTEVCDAIDGYLFSYEDGAFDPFARKGTFDEQSSHFILSAIHATISNVVDHLEAASQLSSPIEKMMYLRLADFFIGNTGYGTFDITVKPQCKIGRYVVDFLVTYEGSKVVIECDGHDFHEKTKQQVEKDKKRERELVSKGYTVLRYSGSEIYNGRVDVAEDLVNIFRRNAEQRRG